VLFTRFSRTVVIGGFTDDDFVTRATKVRVARPTTDVVVSVESGVGGFTANAASDIGAADVRGAATGGVVRSAGEIKTSHLIFPSLDGGEIEELTGAGSVLAVDVSVVRISVTG
jgi:hypothetical protein